MPENYKKEKKTKAEIWFDIKNILFKLMFAIGISIVVISLALAVGYIIYNSPIIILTILFLAMVFWIFFSIKDY